MAKTKLTETEKKVDETFVQMESVETPVVETTEPPTVAQVIKIVETILEKTTEPSTTEPSTTEPPTEPSTIEPPTEPSTTEPPIPESVQTPTKKSPPTFEEDKASTIEPATIEPSTEHEEDIHAEDEEIDEIDYINQKIVEVASLLEKVHNYSYLNCGRHLKDGISYNSLKLFYLEFGSNGNSDAIDFQIMKILKDLFE